MPATSSSIQTWESDADGSIITVDMSDPVSLLQTIGWAKLITSKTETTNYYDDDFPPNLLYTATIPKSWSRTIDPVTMAAIIADYPGLGE